TVEPLYRADGTLDCSGRCISGWRGHCRDSRDPLYFQDPPLPPELRGRAEANLMIHLAGGMAQQLYTGKRYRWEPDDDGDGANVDRSSRRLVPSDADRSAFLGEMIKRTEALLGEPETWVAVEAV